MKTLILSCLAIILFSCAPKGDENTVVTNLKSIEEYPAVEVSMQQPLVFKDSVIFSPKDIWVEDSLLVVKAQNENGFLRIYSINSGELLGAYGVVGRGPGEYVFPDVFKNTKGEYLISDHLRFSVVDIKQLLEQENYKPQIHDLEQGVEATNFLAMPNDNEIIFNAGNKDDQLYFMPLSGGEMVPYNNFPHIDGVKVNNFIASSNVFRSSMVRGGDYIYAAYSYYPIIDIISIADKTVRRSMHPVRAGVNDVKIVDDLNAVMDNRYYYNMSSYVTNNAFYTLYYGASEEDMDSLSVMPQLLKYNLNGELVVRYKLDDLVLKFCVDDAGKTAYFLTFDEDYNAVVVRSDLPEIK